jgi:hypothetical protein
VHSGGENIGLIVPVGYVTQTEWERSSISLGKEPQPDDGFGF